MSACHRSPVLCLRLRDLLLGGMIVKDDVPYDKSAEARRHRDEQASLVANFYLSRVVDERYP